MAEEDREDTYDPSSVEVDRAREQGLGVGARDLQRQRDPQGGGGEPADPQEIAAEEQDAADQEQSER